MAKLKPTLEQREIARITSTYGTTQEEARAIYVYLDEGKEIDAAEKLKMTAEELFRVLSGTAAVRKALSEEVANRIAAGAVLGWKTLTELAQGGPAAVRLTAAKALIDRQFGKEPSRLDIHVHRGASEDRLMARINELMVKLKIASPPGEIIDVVPTMIEPPSKPHDVDVNKVLAQLRGPISEPWEDEADAGQPD